MSMALETQTYPCAGPKNRMREEAGSIFLTLTARPGVQIERSGIEECLAYMLHGAVKE